MKIKKKTLKRILFIAMLILTLTNCFTILFGTSAVFAEGSIDENDGIDIPSGFGALLNRTCLGNNVNS